MIESYFTHFLQERKKTGVISEPILRNATGFRGAWFQEVVLALHHVGAHELVPDQGVAAEVVIVLACAALLGTIDPGGKRVKIERYIDVYPAKFKEIYENPANRIYLYVQTL